MNNSKKDNKYYDFTVLENTSSYIGDFMQEKAISKRGTQQEDDKPNFLSSEEQVLLIEELFGRCHNVKIDGQKEILLDLKNGKVQHIERNFKNFKTIIQMTFRTVSKEGFESINLPKLFEVIKSKNSYSFRTSTSIFHQENKLRVNEASKELINELQISYNFNLNDVSRSEYDDIVEGIGRHWQGLIPMIVNHIVAGKFVSDKKNIWLLILADSNFGKSKLFKWLEPFGGCAFLDFKDLSSNGISDKSPDEIEGKMCLVIDEVTSFHRNLFKIEDYLMVRPMRNHSINIPINSRILLSADGGTFNNEYMDKQIINRVALVDLRDKDTEDLGNLDITKKYGKYKIQLVMTNYLYKEIFNRLNEYRSLSKTDRANKADGVISDVFKNYRQNKSDFFQIVEKCLYEILEDPKNALDNFTYNTLHDAMIKVDNAKLNGWIIKRPQELIPKCLINYDKSLEYELGYKTVKQIESKIGGFTLGSWTIDQKTVRGLYIPASNTTELHNINSKINNIKELALRNKA